MTYEGEFLSTKNSDSHIIDFEVDLHIGFYFVKVWATAKDAIIGEYRVTTYTLGQTSPRVVREPKFT